MKKFRNHLRNLRTSNEMVSDIVGTIVLLGIAVVIFSSIYSVVLSHPVPTEPAKVTIVGKIEGDTIILEHRGGEALGPKTTITITIPGNNKTLKVEENLIDNNGDGLWSIGERLVHKFNYSDDWLYADVMAIDIQSKSLILTATIDICPGECDIGVKVIKVIDNNENHSVVKNINLTVIATNYRGNMNASNISIYCKLPDVDGISYNVTENSTGTTYDFLTGIWHIKELNLTESATLNITLNVTRPPYTQLALLLDGSTSILPADWTIMKEGIALAITNGYIPHNGQVELTVIQFGGWTDNRAWAQLELLSFGGPVVLTDANYMAVASAIQAIPQISESPAGGGTAMSCALRLAADVLSGDPNNYLIGTPFAGMASPNYNWPRQVVNLVTDGQPNMIYDDDNRYTGTWADNGGPNEFVLGKLDAEAALDYFLGLVPMDEAEGDEIDAEAVGTATDIPWLRDYIVWPQPGYDDWPPTGPGWVRYINDYTEFANTICKQFELIFNPVTITAEIISSTPFDPNPENNKASETIMKEEEASMYG